MKNLKDFTKEDAIPQVNTELLEQEEYRNISTDKIALLIQEYHNEKITNTLIESYIKLASSKIFYPDPVIIEMRKLNQFSRVVNDKFDFILDDGNVVAVNEETLNKLNNIEDSLKSETFTYMQENIENFLTIIKAIE